jgi:hypothetical protein
MWSAAGLALLASLSAAWLIRDQAVISQGSQVRPQKAG